MMAGFVINTFQLQDIKKKEELDVYYYEQRTFTHNCNWFLLFGSAVLRLEGVLQI